MVERKYRTILQLARSLIFQFGLPTNYWGEAILHATYLVSRLPSFVLSWNTPYEILFQRPVEYCQLRWFGCLCYSTITKPHTDQFSPRALR